MRFSIVVPVYYAGGGAEALLARNLASIAAQTFTDYEVIVPDNADDETFLSVCKQFTIPIKHFFNPHKGMAANTNAGITASTGELIKILYMDDYFAHDKALELIDRTMGKDKWLVSGNNHDDSGKKVNRRYPSYTELVARGINTVGSPSVLTIVNDAPLLFDETMSWTLDCDYYTRLYRRYGSPGILYDINVTIGLGTHQMTHKLSPHEKAREEELLVTKHT